jgi:hypothetical protein
MRNAVYFCVLGSHSPTNRVHYFLGQALLRAVPASSTLSLVLAVLLGVTGLGPWRAIVADPSNMTARAPEG